MKLREKTAIILFISAIVIWFIGLVCFANSIATTTPKTPTKKLDAIVVLTGGTNRINSGFDLLEKRLGRKLFISGVYRGVDAKELVSRWKKTPYNNIIDSNVELGFEAYNTKQNATETIAWLLQEKYTSLYLVTSNYHMKRSLLEFQKRAPQLKIMPYPVKPNNFDLNKWWSNTKILLPIIKEYNKYTAVYLINKFLEN